VPNWRSVTSVALLIYSVGIIFFALHPVDDIHWAEWVAVILAAIAAFGLVAHMISAVYVPGEEYAYLITGYAGFTTMLLYLADTADGSVRRTGVALFLLSGAIAAYGAFLAQDEVRVRDG